MMRYCLKILGSDRSHLLKIGIYKKTFVRCLIGMMIFFTTSNAQQSQIPMNNSELPRCAFGFEKTILKETDIKDARSAIDYWIKDTGKFLDMRLEGFIFDDFNSIMQEINKNKIDVASISPLSYLKNKQKLNLVPGFAPLIGGKKTRKYLLIVHNDSLISGIIDLKGKKLAVLKANEVGKLYVNILLLRTVKKEAEDFFASISEKDKFSQVILSVFFGQMDAGIATETSFKSMIELNPQIGKRLKVIEESPEVMHMISFFNKNFKASLQEKVRDGILHMGDVVQGKQIMLAFRIDGVVPAQESDLESLDALLKEYIKLKGSD